MRRSKEELNEELRRLNELAGHWYRAKQMGDSANTLNVCAKLCTELYEGIDRLLGSIYGYKTGDEADSLSDAAERSKHQEALSEFFIKDFQRFDPAKAPFTAFLGNRMAFRRKDIAVADAMAIEYRKDDTGRRIRKTHSHASLDAPLDPGNPDSPTLFDKRRDAAQSDGSISGNIDFDETLVELITMMLNLPSLLSNRQKHGNRQLVYRMLFTNRASAYVRQTPESRRLIRHERDLFDAMQLPLPDFYMRHENRTIAALIADETRSYAELVDGRPDKPVRLPAHADVLISYLRRREHIENVGEGRISQLGADFYELLTQVIGR